MLGSLKNGCAECLRACRSVAAKDIFHASKPEFFPFTTNFDHSFRDKNQGCARLERDYSGVSCGMGKQSQRQPGSTEFRDIGTVPHQAVGVARIEIADRPKFFVVAADERRA